MSTRSFTSTKPQRQKGLTLIEIMIALSISFVLLGGVLKVFASSKQTYRIQEALSRVQENGRYAMEFISQDARMSDFWGCVGNLGSVTNNLNPGGVGFVDFVNAGAVGGTDGATDTLTLRGGFGGGSIVQAAFGPLTTSSVNVPAGHPFQQNDFAIVSDCVAGDIFQVSSVNATQIAHAVVAGSPANINANLSKIYQSDASVYRIRDIVYTIATGAGGQPALFRNINQTGAVELIEGVENMQVLYGEDTNADGSPNTYINATGVTSMANVVSIRVVFTLMTLEDNITMQQGGADNRLRRTFTTTVAIRNRLS